MLAAAVGTALPAPGFAQTYVRGGVLLDRGQDARFTDKDCDSQERSALYGCGMGIDGEVLSSVGDFGEIPGLEVGLGYILHPALRLEGAIQYRPEFSFDGRSNFSGLELSDRREVSAELSALSGMAAAYVDIFELLLLQFATPIGPFIGAGGGLTLVDIGETRMDFPSHLYHRAGRQPPQPVVDADGRLRDLPAGAGDGRPGLALHGPRRRRNAERHGAGRLARWKP